jgi:3-oxoacyl-[acyl-carrier-protein] synthase-3
MRKIKIISTGKYLPKRVVAGAQIDKILGLAEGRSAQMSGVESRHYIQDETASEMGSYALMEALEKSGIKYDDLDAIVCASGTMEQAIPCTAALIQRQMKRPDHNIPCFDVNSTCLSFVTAFDVVSSLLETSRFKNVAIVSTEIASVGLNDKQHEAYSLFGDGAAAVIVTRPADGESSGLISAMMKTYSEGADHCRIPGGGSKHHPSKNDPFSEIYKFNMDGRKVFKMVLETIEPFFSAALATANMKLEDIDFIVPHQASGSGMELVRRKLGIPTEKYVDILKNHGNMIAASIPLALHYAIESGRIVRGNKVMLMGTSAGLSIGSVIIEY